MERQTYPKVTIGIPTYNSESRINNSLRSALEQDYPNLEILISDNGSSDGTEKICQEFCAQDSRVVYVRQEKNLGPIKNFNYLLRESNADYFMWLADDDTLEENIISTFVEFLENNPGYSLVGGLTSYHSDEGTRINDKVSFEEDSPSKRAISAYRNSGDGSIIYGLMAKKYTDGFRLLPLIGDDWHFIAALAFQGKTKMLDKISYYKNGCTTSASFQKYARIIGERKVWGYLPFFKIALDAFRLIVWKNKVYHVLPFSKRLATGCMSFMKVSEIYFRIHAGRMLRFMRIKTPSEQRYEENASKLEVLN